MGAAQAGQSNVSIKKIKFNEISPFIEDLRLYQEVVAELDLIEKKQVKDPTLLKEKLKNFTKGDPALLVDDVVAFSPTRAAEILTKKAKKKPKMSLQAINGYISLDLLNQKRIKRLPAVSAQASLNVDLTKVTTFLTQESKRYAQLPLTLLNAHVEKDKGRAQLIRLFMDTNALFSKNIYDQSKMAKIKDDLKSMMIEKSKAYKQPIAQRVSLSEAKLQKVKDNLPHPFYNFVLRAARGIGSFAVSAMKMVAGAFAATAAVFAAGLIFLGVASIVLPAIFSPLAILLIPITLITTPLLTAGLLSTLSLAFPIFVTALGVGFIAHIIYNTLAEKHNSALEQSQQTLDRAIKVEEAHDFLETLEPTPSVINGTAYTKVFSIKQRIKEDEELKEMENIKAVQPDFF